MGGQKVMDMPDRKMSLRKPEFKKPAHVPKIGFFVYYLSFMAVIGGFLFGYDTGIVSSAMLYIPDNDGMKPMNSLWNGLIVSITPGMAAVGSLLAGPASDRFGRKKVIIVSSFIFAAGAIVCAAAPEKVCLLVGRILLGLAIGFASMIVPIYVGEASPSHIRGMLVTSFQLMITFGLVASDVIAGGFSYVNPENVGWRLMLGFAMVPSVVQFIGFFFLPESPRYLYKIGQSEVTKHVLKKIYGADEDWINYELQEIDRADKEEKAAMELVQDSFVIVRMIKTPHVFRALAVGFLLQMFQQLGGVNTIMYYTGTIVKSAGVQDTHTAIWITAAVASANFLATFVPIGLVERMGRRVLLLISIAGVLLSLVMLGVSFLLVNRDSADTITEDDLLIFPGNRSFENFDYCRKQRNCDYCTTAEACGFCQPGEEKATGYCLPSNTDNTDEATTGYCGPQNNGTFVFMADYCKTKFTAMPIVFMVVYLIFFAIGFAPLPWVLNAEFYPLWARSTGCSLSTCSNWIFNLIISLTFLLLSEAVTKYGAYFIYAGITLVAFIFVFIFVPETKGVTMEEVEQLFMTKSEKKKAVRAMKEANEEIQGIMELFTRKETFSNGNVDSKGA